MTEAPASVTHHPANERIKYTYRRQMKDALGRSELTIDRHLAALHRFEQFTGHQDFKETTAATLSIFDEWLRSQMGLWSDRPLGFAFRYQTMSAVRVFFRWLGTQRDYRRIAEWANK